MHPSNRTNLQNSLKSRLRAHQSGDDDSSSLPAEFYTLAEDLLKQ